MFKDRSLQVKMIKDTDIKKDPVVDTSEEDFMRRVAYIQAASVNVIEAATRGVAMYVAADAVRKIAVSIFTKS